MSPGPDSRSQEPPGAGLEGLGNEAPGAGDPTEPELDAELAFDLTLGVEPGTVDSPAADLPEPPPAEPDPLEVPPGVAEANTPADASPPAATGASRWSRRDRVRERELLLTVATLPVEDPRRTAARDELVTMHLPLAAYLARRFRDRGEPLDDLTQVATVGLIKAVDRFNPERGFEFSTFATPTIVGELKRHFRDKGWAIRVPRRLQELRIAIARATSELSQTIGGAPTVAQIAAHLGVTEEDVLEGMESAQAYATLSLNSGGSDSDEESVQIADTLGEEDPGLLAVEHRHTVHPLLATLPPREQRIMHMRFFENKTQVQIAAEVGISQMHVSRLLAKSLAQMRSTMQADPAMWM